MLDDLLQRVAVETGAFFDDIRSHPVESRPTADRIREHLSRYDFAEPVAADALVADAVAMLRRWDLHVVHPRYFGLFNPSVRPVSVAADALVAAFNPQLATWAHAPAANEIERHVLRFLLKQIGFDQDSSFASFTTCGQEANMSATLSALTQSFPEVERQGLRDLPGQPVFYLSSEGHHSFQKIAHATGLGRDAVRAIPVDARFRMRSDSCAAAIAEDRRDGRKPFMVVATAGTTGAGAIDPLPELADLCAREDLWLHVDAAWGGTALLSPRLRGTLHGIERAHSVTWDAHKWLSVPVGAGMFFCRLPEPVFRTFRVTGASYVPPNATDNLDPYTTTIQWSRRFIGLKVFMALAEAGVRESARAIEHHVDMAERLIAALARDGWIVANDSPLAIVCFTHPAIRDGVTTAQAVADAVNQTGRAWLSQVMLPGRGSVLRACVTSFRTTAEDVDGLVEELRRALTR